jgi:hypothetical protein
VPTLIETPTAPTTKLLDDGWTKGVDHLWRNGRFSGAYKIENALQRVGSEHGEVTHPLAALNQTWLGEERSEELAERLDRASFALVALLAPLLINLGLIATILTWSDPGGVLIALGILAAADGILLAGVVGGMHGVE